MSEPLATSTPEREGAISLFNPPNAPKKKVPPFWRPWALEGIPPFPNLSTEEEEEVEWVKEEERFRREEEQRQKYEAWNVRPKYLTFVPADIEGMGSAYFLRFLHRKYFPASQPRNEEEVEYLGIMRKAIEERMAYLNIAPEV